MKSRQLFALALSSLVVCLIAIVWIWDKAPPIPEAPTAERNVGPAHTTARSVPEELNAPTIKLSPIELGLRAALVEQHAARAQLRDAELALSELEEFVSELEKRGEDPAEYAEEGLEKFRPAYLEFETAQSRLDMAESIIAELSTQLSRSELETVQRQAQQMHAGAPVK